MGRSDSPADEHQNRQDHGHKSKDINIVHRGPHHHSNPSLRAFAHDLPSDPTDFEGQAVLWDDEGEDRKRKTKGTNAVQGASAAGVVGHPRIHTEYRSLVLGRTAADEPSRLI